MRRSDDVFFFTLIDFLLQVFFFGLLLFVASQVIQKEKDRKGINEQEQIEKLKKAIGVSNITELTDELTKMAPLNELRGTSDFIQRTGGIQKVKAAVAAASAAGGAEKVSQLNEKVKAQNERLEKLEGWGKVSCIPNEVINGKLQPKSIATVYVTDKLIRLDAPTPEMLVLLKSIGLTFEGVQELSPDKFRIMFSPIIAKQPECRYFLRAITQTQYIDPLRAVWSAFRTV